MQLVGHDQDVVVRDVVGDQAISGGPPPGMSTSGMPDLLGAEGTRLETSSHGLVPPELKHGEVHARADAEELRQVVLWGWTPDRLQHVPAAAALTFHV